MYVSGSQAVLAINVTNQQTKFTKCQESKCFTSIFLSKQKIQCTSEFKFLAATARERHAMKYNEGH